MLDMATGISSSILPVHSSQKDSCSVVNEEQCKNMIKNRSKGLEQDNINASATKIVELNYETNTKENKYKNASLPKNKDCVNMIVRSRSRSHSCEDDDKDIEKYEDDIEEVDDKDSSEVDTSPNPSSNDNMHYDNANQNKSDGSNSIDEEEDSEMKFICPICDTMLNSQHEFTLHIRSHNNNDIATSVEESQMQLAAICKGFTCRICGKVLSSSSSLDRHVLVHSGERPFKCKICGVSFTTNGNMHRHMRTHPTNQTGKHPDAGYNSESDASSDSYSSTKRNLSSPLVLKRKKSSRTTTEFNNNSIELSPRSLSDLCNKRKHVSQDDNGNAQRRKTKHDNRLNKFKCPVCEREDFLSLNLLETHLEECHPEYKARCEPCNLIFKNHRVLNLHRFMVHPDQEQMIASPGSTVGFKDLTFVDFSSEKFPYIARMVCEQSLHRASSGYHKFQCDRCERAFPLASALKIHQQNCCYASSREVTNEFSSSDNEGPTDLSRPHNSVSESSDDIEDDKRRESFFARLDLQNKSSPSSPDYDERRIKNEHLPNEGYFNSSTEVKDLADIQSIISVTSAGGLIPDLSKSPQPSIIEVTPPDSGSRAEEEEQQDCFAAEFRKMKLRGEFPCRLCTAIFPNLRALKGHNRVHLSASPGGNMGPYRCNMCPHFSSDKSALIRHMRTHNGDRPYECSLCRYAFTTKANCERHLRNRHAKMSREDVKKSIIYHPSEDPTNDINAVTPNIVSAPSTRDDVKRSLFSDNNCGKESETSNSSSVTQTIIQQQPAKIMRAETKVHNPLIIQDLKPSKLQDMLIPSDCTLFRRRSLDVGTMTSDEEIANEKKLKQTDVPLDLSMDALDLSRKRNSDKTELIDGPIIVDDSEPQDLSKKPKKLVQEFASIDKHQMYNPNLNLLTPPQVQNFDVQPKHQIPLPKLDLSQFYSNSNNLNLSFFLNNPAFNSFSPAPPAAFPPYFLTPPPHMLFPRNPTQDFVEMREHLQKELIRGLQLTSGGSLVLDQLATAHAADRVKSLQSQAFSEYNRRMEIPPAGDLPPSDNKLLTPAFTDQPDKIKHSGQKPVEKIVPAPRHESSSVKMVIKNGVLIPKQKQRRYRTERPFSCEHCSARFTLRSNMERHIKQQHPQYWTQRQRSTGHLGGRRSTKSFSLQPTGSLNSQLSYFPHLAVHSDEHSTGSRCSTPPDDNIHKTESPSATQLLQPTLISDANKPSISDEVKNAIAQQLKLKQNLSDKKDDDLKSDVDESNEQDDMDDEEEDEQLVIDEEVKDDEAKEIHNIKISSQKEENSVVDLASVSRLLDNASTQTFKEYFHNDEDQAVCENSEEDEEGLVAGSTSEGNNSGSDENRSESDTAGGNGRQGEKKKSAYSLAPNRVSCPYCFRKFPWSSSLRRHVLTHTGQKPFKCSHCSLLFTTKSNCDRHLLRKHGGHTNNSSNINNTNSSSSNSSNEAKNLNDNACNENTELSGDPSKKQNSNYTMRNVPERPYKCKYCPSSTFSTLSNLKKHLSCKHLCRMTDENKKSQDDNQSGYESHGSACEDMLPDVQTTSENAKTFSAVDLSGVPVTTSNNQVTETIKTCGTSNVPQDSQTFSSSVMMQSSMSSDLPFKCHLCDSSFSERQEALDHIREFHSSEYQLLASKGALESNIVDDNTAQDDGLGEENLEQLRGKFPDYANRKVMCAFCLRRFWSAEDLRRHMRTHTGERPFSCDICRRRFTLKHSMLRHRKKHSLTSTTSPFASDEEPMAINNNNNIVPSSKMCNEESDLISNLLGIHDRSIVDKMLISKSAEDAAKLLGVQK